MSTKRLPPVTISEVAASMRELLEEGEDVSVRAVYKRVGRGSLTTISKHMESVRAGTDSPETNTEQFPARLEALMREAVEALDDLAVERVAEERAQVEAIRRNVESKWNGLVSEKEDAVRLLEAEQRLTADLRLRLAVETQKLNETALNYDEYKGRAVKAEALNEHLNERHVEYSRKNEELKTHYENYSEQVKAQRQIDQTTYAERIGSLERNLSISHGNELRLTEQFGQAQREAEKLTGNIKNLTAKAEQAEYKRDELQRLVAELSVDQDMSQKREVALQTKLESTTIARDIQTNLVSALQARIIEGHGRFEKLLEEGSAESKSVILNLIEHSRRVFDLAKTKLKESNPDFEELAIAQRAIESLFNPKG
jgi:hypothetical protein